MLLQEQGLFAAAIEDERVAPLQPGDHLALPRLLDEQVADRLLLHRLGRRDAHVDELRGVLGVPQQPGRDQAVVDDDVGAPHALQAVRGDEARIAGTGADQVDGWFDHLCVRLRRSSRSASRISPPPRPGAVRRLPCRVRALDRPGQTPPRAPRGTRRATRRWPSSSASPPTPSPARRSASDIHPPVEILQPVRPRAPSWPSRRRFPAALRAPGRRPLEPRWPRCLVPGLGDTARSARASRSGPRAPTDAGRPPPGPGRRSRRPGRACAGACPRSRAWGRSRARDGPRKLRARASRCPCQSWRTLRALSSAPAQDGVPAPARSTSASRGVLSWQRRGQRQPAGKRRRHVLAAVHGDVYRACEQGFLDLLDEQPLAARVSQRTSVSRSPDVLISTMSEARRRARARPPPCEPAPAQAGCRACRVSGIACHAPSNTSS